MQANNKVDWSIDSECIWLWCSGCQWSSWKCHCKCSWHSLSNSWRSKTISFQYLLLLFIFITLIWSLFTYDVELPLSWADKKVKKPITGSVFINITFRPIKGEEIKKEGQAYQKVSSFYFIKVSFLFLFFKK